MYAAALVAVDFSPATANLLKRLEDLRQFDTRKIMLLHVLPKGGDMEDALERLETKAARLGSAFEVDCLVREGRPAQAIMKTAEERNIPLIVLAARNHSLAHRLVLGSVADEVVHWTDRAVLLIDALNRPTEERVIQRNSVLLATNGSTASVEAEKVALSVAHGKTLNVVTVVDGEALESGWKITAGIVAKAEQNGIPVKRSVETGRPADAIARAAAVTGSAVIIVGRRVTAQRGLGSTAQRICEIARRPVLLVPTATTPVRQREIPAMTK